MNPLHLVARQGQQIWLDNLSRTLIREGALEHLVRDDGVTGVTTNPAIFHKAIADGKYYREALTVLKTQRLSAEQRYERLVVPDVQAACDLLLPVFERSRGRAGYVSLEVSPALAHDAAGTLAAGKRLAREVVRENLLIKVPATDAGLEAIEALLAEGINVNVTLMFSLEHVRQVGQAYLRGVQRLCAAGGDATRAMSVASLFLSRVDTLVDKRLDEIGGKALALRGKTAVAMAKLAYRWNRTFFNSEGFAPLRAAGIAPQVMLWASTGTKNPAYSDVLYVEPLIGSDTVNTLPDATLVAFRDHGKVGATLDEDIDAAQAQFDALAALGIDFDDVGAQLQREGLKQFEDAYAALLTLTA